MDKLYKNKKGQISGPARKAIDGIVLVIVLFLLYANLVPEAQTAGDTLNGSGVPLGSIFASSGFVFVLLMVGLLLVILRVVLPGSGK